MAEVAKFNPDEQRAYQSSVKYYRDIKNSLDTAFADGMAKRTLDIARNALITGLPIDTIVNLTGLRPDEIEALRDANA